jgi:hypothetical protein
MFDRSAVTGMQNQDATCETSWFLAFRDDLKRLCSLINPSNDIFYYFFGQRIIMDFMIVTI